MAQWPSPPRGWGLGDDVIIPGYTFVATATAALEVGAVPIFADIDPQTYTPDPASAAACLTPRPRAIMLVHLAGRRTWMPSWPWPSVLILLSSKTRRRRGVPLGRAGGLGPWGMRRGLVSSLQRT
jgi:hypothetical protein